MQNKSFYRKYRPNAFCEIIGQTNIIKILQNSILNNSFSHAYLFSGAKGTGKTSTAKIFAKAINCQNNNNGDVCNQCENCISINSDNCMDILEIDGASNNGVDEIRTIIDNVNLSPMNFKYKIYIIDEVHMLTTAAFNALLKTLEEPPPHIIFIFATTQPYKVIPTVISRCQWFEFKKINLQATAAQFIKILTQEKIKYEVAAISELALLSDGSLRDGLNYLEKIFNYCDNITLKNVEKVFSVLSTKSKVQFLINIFNGNMQAVMEQLLIFDEYTIEYQIFIIDFIYIIEDILIYTITNESSLLKNINQQQVAIFASVVKSDLYLVLNSFNEILMQNNLDDLKPILILKILNLINDFTKKYDLVADFSFINDNNGEVGTPTSPLNPIVSPKLVSNQNLKVKAASTTPAVTPEKNKKLLLLTSSTSMKLLTPEKNNVGGESTIKKMENHGIIDNAINLILQADKSIRKEINEKWKTINDLIKNDKFRNITKFYLNTLVTAAAKNGIIIITENIIQANLINQKFLSKEHQDFLFMLLGKKYMVYALDKKQWQQTRKKYQALVTTNNLPPIVDIVVSQPMVDTFDQIRDKDPTLKFLQKIFTEIEEI